MEKAKPTTKQRRKVIQGEMVKLGGLPMSEKPEHAAFGTHPLLGTRSRWVKRKGKEREGGMDSSGDLHAKHRALPKLRGQGAEWLR